MNIFTRKSDVGWGLGLVIVLTLLLFGRSLGFGLLWWDDFHNICDNPAVNSSSWTGLSAIWTQPYHGFYAPLPYSAWMLLLKIPMFLWGSGYECLDTAGLLHAFSLFLHIANVILVFALLRTLRKEPSSWPALLGALVFCVHPLQTETVAWITCQRDLLSAFFGLCGLVLLLSQDFRLSARGKVIFANLFFILAILAKPSGVAMPLLAVLLLIDSQGFKIKQYIFMVSPSLLAAVPLTIFAKSLQANELLRFTLPYWQRPLVFMQAFGFYLWKFLVPWDLTVDYGRSIDALNSHPWLYVTGGLALGAVLSAIFVKSWRLPVAWILLSLLPVSGLIPFGFQEISTVGDRYFYVAMIGFSFAFFNLAELKAGRRILLPCLLCWAILTFIQLGYWVDDKTLFARNLEINPDSKIAGDNLGHALYMEGKFNDAIPILRQALVVNPGNTDAWINLARAFERMENINAAEAIYRECISRGFDDAIVNTNLGALMISKGNLPEAERLFTSALNKNPLHFEALFNLGVLYSNQGNVTRSRLVFARAQRLRPEDPRVTKWLQTLDQGQPNK